MNHAWSQHVVSSQHIVRAVTQNEILTAHLLVLHQGFECHQTETFSENVGNHCVLIFQCQMFSFVLMTLRKLTCCKIRLNWLQEVESTGYVIKLKQSSKLFDI